MAYRMKDRADVPWHSVGFALYHDASPDEMLAASGLDWTVSKAPVDRRRTCHAIRPHIHPRIKLTHEGTDYFALVRTATTRY